MIFIRLIFSMLITGILMGCNSTNIECTIDSIQNNYENLPEGLIEISADSVYKSQYIIPTNRYSHGILGDAIEAAGLEVSFCDTTLIYSLSNSFVFEDIKPRFADFNFDGIPEIICILTHIEKGASVAAFEINNQKLVLMAQSNFIGRTKRWLNIAAIDDLDSDGVMEIAWITTPHIGGTLKIGRISGNEILVIDSIAGFSNHQIGSGNLDLTLLSEKEANKILYVPRDGFSSIVGFRFESNTLTPVDTIEIIVDPLIPLTNQLAEFL